MPWLYLLLASIAEVSFTTALRLSDDFRNLAMVAAFVLSVVLSLVFLELAQRHIPLGTAYAVWTGVGAVGTMGIGILFFGEPASLTRALLIGRHRRLRGGPEGIRRECLASHWEVSMPHLFAADVSPRVSRRNPTTMWDMTKAGFSQISIAAPGRLAFLSGQIASFTDGRPLPADLAEQARMATTSLAAALDELGASASDIVLLRVYVVGATTEGFAKVLAELRGLLGDEMPSVTTLGVQALYAPDILVEIEMVVSTR